MQLYFVRHGIAELAVEGMMDAARELTREGIHRTKSMARTLAAAGVKPRRLFSSPLVRAQQTAQIISEVLEIKVITRKALAPGFTIDALPKLIAGLKPTDEVIFVGHEPDLSGAVSQLIGGGEIIMKKGSIARVDVSLQEPLRGALIWLLAPKLVEK